MKKRILAVDDNKNITDLLTEYFESSKEIEVVDTAADGEEAWDKIRKNSNNYDVVLLDLIMPKKDGMYVLEKIKEEKMNIRVIVVTSYNEEETIRNISEYGVKYFVLKPFDLKQLEKKIIEITSKKRDNTIIDLQEGKEIVEITNMLHKLGIPSHIKGYQYVRDAINLVYTNPALIGGITKELYPEIGKIYNTSTTRVERAIRHAIEVCWNRGDLDYMTEIFGSSVDIDRAKPTNSEFIVTVADRLKLDRLRVR